MIIKYPFKILLVDDQEDVLDIMEMFLEDRTEFEITKFSDPLYALKHLKTNEVNIAIIDIKMDKMSGDDLLREIENLELGIDVIMVTGSKNLIELQACFRCGARSYMSKPFTKQQFNDIVDRSKKKLECWNKSYKKVIAAKKAGN